MFFDSGEFKALEGGVSAVWLQQQLHLQNLANVETPGYKSKSVAFQQVLRDAEKTVLQAQVVTDEASEVRPDGNNVDSDKESVELYKAYAQYSMLLDKVRGQFTNYNYVLNSGMK